MWGVGGSSGCGGGGCCEECRRRCGLIHGPLSAANSFFKVLIGPDFSDLLYIPPMFAPHVSGLVGQKVVLKDSRGDCWRVMLTRHRGSLAFRKGWRDFLSYHALRTGDFLVFHFLGSHFLVKIYDRTACEKTVFVGDRPHGDESPSMGKDPRFGRSSGPRSRLSSNTEVEYEDEVVFIVDRERTAVDAPVSAMLVDDSDCGRGHRVVGEGPDYCGQTSMTRMPDDDTQAKVETHGQPDDSEEILSVNPLAIAIYDANAVAATAPAEPSFQNGTSGERTMTKKRGRPRKDCSNTSTKSGNSGFGNLSLDEKPVSVMVPYQIEGSAAALELAGASSLIPVETCFSLKATAISTSYLELPVDLLSILPKSRGMKKLREGKVVILEDQLRRWWPVLYRQEQVKFLSAGWKCFCEANHISPGDECLLVAQDLSKAVFGVSILSATSLVICQ